MRSIALLKHDPGVVNALDDVVANTLAVLHDQEPVLLEVVEGGSQDIAVTDNSNESKRRRRIWSPCITSGDFRGRGRWNGRIPQADVEVFRFESDTRMCLDWFGLVSGRIQNGSDVDLR